MVTLYKDFITEKHVNDIRMVSVSFFIFLTYNQAT